jgi:hypothetical protein
MWKFILVTAALVCSALQASAITSRRNLHAINPYDYKPPAAEYTHKKVVVSSKCTSYASSAAFSKYDNAYAKAGLPQLQQVILAFVKEILT